jgi:hypothetical protein
MLSVAVLSLFLHAGDVVIVRRIETSPERASDVRGRVFDVLKSKGVDVREPKPVESEACAMNRACLSKVARELSADWLVTIDLGHVEDEMVVRLELLIGAHLDKATSSVFTLKTAAYPAASWFRSESLRMPWPRA